jgi:CRISPR-associated endonuclease Csy4
MMNHVFNKLHRAIVSLKTQEIGISFPEYQIKLGKILRIHGSMTNLHNLLALNWLNSLSDYCGTLNVNDVPNNVKYRVVSRVRPNMSKSKLRRLQKRGSIATGDKKKYIAKMFSEGLGNPYVDLYSGSTGENFRLFFSFSPILDQPIPGKFDSYGLSKNATIPWF